MTKKPTDGDALSELQRRVLLKADEWLDGKTAGAQLSFDRFVKSFLELEKPVSTAPSAVMNAILELDRQGLLALTERTRATGVGEMMAGFRVAGVGRLEAASLRASRSFERVAATSVSLDLGEQFEDGFLEHPRCRTDSTRLAALAKTSSSVVPILLLLVLEPRWIRENLRRVLGKLESEERIKLRGSRKSPGLSERWLRDIAGTLADTVPGIRCTTESGRAVVTLAEGGVSFEFRAGENELDEADVRRVLRESFGLQGLDPMAVVVAERRGVERGYDPGGQAAVEPEEQEGES